MEHSATPSGESFPRLYLKDADSESMDGCIVNYASEHYDLTMSLKDPLHPSFSVFLESLKRECTKRGLRFLLVHEAMVAETIEKIRIGKLSSGFHLDFFSLWHEALELRTETGAWKLLDGLKEFQEHMGGELTITLLREIGSGEEVHQMEPEEILLALAWLRQGEPRP
jgi:hypothetical protein